MSDVKGGGGAVARASASRAVAAGSSQTSHSCRAAACVALITCADLRAGRARRRSSQLLDFLQLFSKYERMQGCRPGETGRNFTLTVIKVMWNIWAVIRRHLQHAVPHNPELTRHKCHDL